MRRVGRAPFRVGCAIVLGALAASCATLPSPQGASPSAPPARDARRPATAEESHPPAPGPLRLDREPTIDVGLAWDLDSVVVRATDRIRAGRHDPPTEDAGEIVAVWTEGGRTWFDLHARPAPEGGWRRDAASVLASGDTLWIEDPTHGPRAVLGWRGRTWRGALKVFLNPRGRLSLAVRLPLETYLLGVVPGEIGGLDARLLEAGRAQAIAARSYTLFYLGRRASEGFDLYGTVEDQVYGPAETERPLATRCVETTRGMVALSEGRAIRANYCSTCGGITAEVWEAWPADPLAYLVSHRDAAAGEDYCAASPQYRWREEWSAEAFTALLQQFAPAQGVAVPGAGVGTLVDVRVPARSRSGRAWRLEVETTTGTIVVPAYAIRAVLRRPGNTASILRSTLFKIDVRRDPRTQRVLAVVASGAGSGHGVGLCQTGALGMARAGAKADAILEHYYRGIRLERFY